MNENILVLNSGFTPVFVTTFKHAMKLLFRNKAEVISVENGNFVSYNINSWQEASFFKREYENTKYKFVETEKSLFGIPKVIRLIKNSRVPEMAKLTRKNVFLRDNNTCCYCNNRFSITHLNIDHVIPKSRGGKQVWENLVCSCFKCNQKKANRTPKEAGMTLHFHPHKPSFYTVFKASINRLNKDNFEEWKFFFPDDFISETYWNTELL